MRNSSNMVLFTFFGSTLPDRVHIGSLNLKVDRLVSRPLQCFSCYDYGHGKTSCNEASRFGNCSAQNSRSKEHCNAAAYCFHCRDTHQFISLGSTRRELLYRQKDGTGATSYASLAARSSVESAGQKTIPFAPFRSVGEGGPVHSANRFALLSHDPVASSLRSDGNNPDMTQVTHVVDVHLHPVSSKPLKGLSKRHHSSAESIDLAQPKQSKVSPGAHDRASSRDCSAMLAQIVSVQPAVTPSVTDWASCDEDGLSLETSDDIVKAVPRGPTVSKSAVKPDPRPPMTGRSDNGSHNSLVGRKAAVQRPGTS
ncbi:hypothetical protein E2C01_057570 [Portunus trituberculatus]|uniref:CCHC-type domain-containing protein n=1 Tax=Portunus trituberculatus TaxID=210409 RepID=A0A5B7GT97_PORTR|nr:hypothetical protein [Portunus trituberculatus]